MSDDTQDRIAAITQFIDAAASVWPLLCAELSRMERDKVESLITQESEQARGYIKALRHIKELPETLQAERIGLTEGLAE